MIKQLLISIRSLLVLTVLTGILYPLVMTAIASGIFPRQASGSMIERGGVIVGTELLAQKFDDARYFHPRPSAADFATVASGAGNQGFTSRKLMDAVRERQVALGPGAPSDLLYASGSGLDPHISPDAAVFQVERVAAARGLPSARVRNLVEVTVTPPQFGFLGQPRVNVLLLNLALDELK